jgi:hypothetical protein
MRRFAAVLYHRSAGFVYNGMGVWKVPEDDVESVGQLMAAYRGVSHCYQRPTYPDWPYNLFSMTHGRPVVSRAVRVGPIRSGWMLRCSRWQSLSSWHGGEAWMKSNSLPCLRIKLTASPWMNG